MSADATIISNLPREFLQSDRGIQLQLARFNQRRLRPGRVSPEWEAELEEECRLRRLEGCEVERQRQLVAGLLEEVPTDAGAFMRWFERLRERGPGQNHPLFPHLRDAATIDEMKWFLTQEIAGEAGFDDLVALTQVRFPLRAKLELARNYWDEMGRGHEKGVHGLLLEHVGQELALQPSIEGTVSEALALANLMVALAGNRRYAYQAVGALGVIEMTAPGRVHCVNEGLRRLHVSAGGRSYFQLHAGLDIKHSAAWNAEVIRPLLESDPTLGQPIAEGALLRLRAGERCFERYSKELGLTFPRRSTPTSPVAEAR